MQCVMNKCDFNFFCDELIVFLYFWNINNLWDVLCSKFYFDTLYIVDNNDDDGSNISNKINFISYDKLCKVDYCVDITV